MRVLIADDDKEICDLLEIYVKNEGFEVEKAHNGQETLDKLYEQEIDCLILDVMMPKKNRFRSCKRSERKIPTSDSYVECKNS